MLGLALWPTVRWPDYNTIHHGYDWATYTQEILQRDQFPSGITQYGASHLNRNMFIHITLH